MRFEKDELMKKNFTVFAVLVALALAAPAFRPSVALAGGQPSVFMTGSAAGRGASTISEAFTGEEFVYQIGFWFFDDVAVGTLTFKDEGNGVFTGTLKARTTGVVDRLIISREDTYVSRMRVSDDGQRLITERFEKTVNKAGKVRNGVSLFDYKKNVMTWRSWGGGKEEKSGVASFPDGITPYDPIAAFYNFRYGAYGPVERGREYTIYSFPKEDHVPFITIRVATEKEIKARAGRYPDKTEYLADARIDKELFGSQSGEIEIYFTDEMVPMHAVAKDILFFGDVRGDLSRSKAGGRARGLALKK